LRVLLLMPASAAREFPARSAEDDVHCDDGTVRAMDATCFDHLSKILAGGGDRRSAIRAVAGFGLAGMLSRSDANASRKKRKRKKKSPPPLPPSPPPPPASRCNLIGGEISCIEPIFELEDCCDIFLGEVCTACGCCLESDSCCGETCCPAGQECCGGRDCCPTDYECCSGGECCHPSMTCCPDGSCHLVCR
jgi:hypothetical protein